MKLNLRNIIESHKLNVVKNHTRFKNFGVKSFVNALSKARKEIANGRDNGQFGQCFGFVNSFIVNFLDFNEYAFYCGVQEAAQAAGFTILSDDIFRLVDNGYVLTMSWSKGGYGGFKYQFKKTESLNNKNN